MRTDKPPILPWVDKIPGNGQTWMIIGATVGILFLLYTIALGNKIDFFLSGFLIGIITVTTIFRWLLNKLVAYIEKNFDVKYKCTTHDFPKEDLKDWNSIEDLFKIKCRSCKRSAGEIKQQAEQVGA